jgi:hypothetical protein
MSIAVIVPVCLQVTPMLDRLRSNLCTFRHEAAARFVVLCNRLTLMSAPALEAMLTADLSAPVQVVHDRERSVAGAWNRGIELAAEAGLDPYLITAVDVAAGTGMIDALLHFGERRPDVPVWSSTASAKLAGAAEESLCRCDFSCFMLRRSTIARHGWFDREYRPAYFEDNDYGTRVVLSGLEPRQVLAARHLHEGSATIKVDPEMAAHVRHWFGHNQERFRAKWGTLSDDYPTIRRKCHGTPFGRGRALTWWPEQDREGYSASAGIYD